MTGPSEPRMVPPDEARRYAVAAGFPSDAVTRRDLAHTAAVLGEQRAAVLALVQQWLDETQEGQGVMRDHWRGVDYVDGDDYRAERCAEQLRAIYGFPE